MGRLKALASRLFWLAVVLPLIAALSLLATGCGRQDEATAVTSGSRPMPVALQVTNTETVVERVPAVGTLLANESIVVRAEISGLIESISFDEGSEVEAGSVLVVLNSDEHRALVEQTQATVELARLSFARAEDMHQKSMMSRQEYDEARARLKESRAALRRNQAVLAKTRLVAPFSGSVGLRHVSPGALIQPGQDLVNLEDIDPIKVEFKLSERFAASIAVGQQVEVLVDALPGRIFIGEIYAVNPRLDPRTRAFSLRARVANADGSLRPRMFARVNLVADSRENAVTVPEEAIWPRREQPAVYRVIDGKAALTSVELGERFDGKVEVRSGLAAGETIITSGHMKIRDGSAVVDVQQPGPGKSAGGTAAERRP
ncbi:MAG TPA: efflux transporter periplasmic adaptor subunit [Gammaproteobacteria bacterium]|nr:efflux transporter periplasmic adaptor subunit [Gammaproteobacteria bacterium]